MVKLFAILMIPAMLLELARHPHGGRLILAWLTGLLLMLLLSVWLIAPALYDPALLHENFQYLLGHHTQNQQWLPNNTLQNLLLSHYLDFPILVLAVIAVLRMRSMRGLQIQSDPHSNLKITLRYDLFPLIWLLCEVVALQLMHPVWPHYYPMLLVPLVWLAALSVGDCFGKKNWDATTIWNLDIWLRQVIRIMLCILILMLPMRGQQINDHFLKAGILLDTQLITAIEQFAESPCLMVTDRPVYPFIAGCSVPPEHAATSWKLLQSGMQSEQTYLRTIDLHNPQLVLLARFSRLKLNLPSALKQRGYIRIYNSENAWLYARNPV
jgi:hypothetical protein